MSAPALGVRKRLVPSYAVVDWSHPLAQNLEFCGLSHSALDIAKNRKGVSIPTAPQVYGSRSSTYGLATVAAWTNASTTDVAFTSGQWTIAVVGQIYGVAATYEMFGRSVYVSESNNQGWAIQSRPTASATRGLGYVSYGNNAASSYVCTNAVLATLGTYVAVGRSNGSNLREVFHNGLRIATNVNNANPPSSTGTLVLGTDNTTGVIGYAWSRALTNGEIAMLTADPFGMLRY